ACDGALEGADELRADGLALGLRVSHTVQALQESLALIHGDQLRTGRGDEVVLHLLALPRAQQAVIHEHTGQAVTNGALHDRGGHSGVHATGEATDGATVLADLLTNLPDELLSNVGGGPVLLQASDLREEAFQHLLAVRAVHDLRVVLHTGHAAIQALESSDRRAGGLRGNGETLRGLRDRVAVAHPGLVRT